MRIRFVHDGCLALDPVLWGLDYCVLQKVQDVTCSFEPKFQHVTLRCWAADLKRVNRHVAVPQEVTFAAKNQYCVAQSCATWASCKMRLDYGHTQNS